MRVTVEREGGGPPPAPRGDAHALNPASPGSLTAGRALGGGPGGRRHRQPSLCRAPGLDPETAGGARRARQAAGNRGGPPQRRLHVPEGCEAQGAWAQGGRTRSLRVGMPAAATGSTHGCVHQGLRVRRSSPSGRRHRVLWSVYIHPTVGFLSPKAWARALQGLGRTSGCGEATTRAARRLPRRSARPRAATRPWR